MKHIGDITQVHGYKIEPVDVIVGGSPCQDLSIAGKRAGLSGERSGLFMEQIRIVKEMREHDRSLGRANEYIRPRWMVWENVDGARSSPGGESRGKDFAAVLEEICKIHNKNARVDVPKGGWPSSGCIQSEDGTFSLAWRVHDAQFWGFSYTDDSGHIRRMGTPQRRKRIALVADFGGNRASEVLFERKGLSGNPKSEQTSWEKIAGDIGEGTPEPDSGLPPRTLKMRGGV